MSIRLENEEEIGWARHQLGDSDVSEIIMGQSPPSETYNRERVGLPFFQGKIDFGLRRPTTRLWCSSPAKVAQPGDVLMSVRAPVGDVNIAAQTCCIGRGLAAIRASDSMDPEFLFYLLMHHKPDLERLGSGAIFKAINRDTLRSFELIFPGPDEQRAIVGVLSKLQATVEVQDRSVATLKELKSATMAKLFREGLRREPGPPRMTPFGEVPAHWKDGLLSEYADVQTGVAKGRKVAAARFVELPYLRIANVQDGYLDLSEIKTILLSEQEVQRYLLREGDVVLTEGGDFDKLGRGYRWSSQVPNCVHQNHIFAVRSDRRRLLPEFFAYQAQSAYGKAYFLSVAHKTTNLACINATKLRSFPLLVPECSTPHLA